MRDKILHLLPDIFELLRAFVSIACDSHTLDHYLIMLDERVHSAKGRLKGREPIGAFLRNIEEHLHAICDPLPLCWESPSRQRVGRVHARC